MRTTQRQRERLIEILASPNGTTWLADQGHGMRNARAWWQTFTSLSSLGLVETVRRKNGDLLSAFKLTDAGRTLAVAIRDNVCSRCGFPAKLHIVGFCMPGAQS